MDIYSRQSDNILNVSFKSIQTKCKEEKNEWNLGSYYPGSSRKVPSTCPNREEFEEQTWELSLLRS